MCCHKKHVGMLIKCVEKKMVQVLNKELEAYDLTLSQHEVLFYLYGNQDKDVYQKDIEEYSESTNPTITGIVKRLEAKELIRRESADHDARCKKILLTEKGKTLCDSTVKIGPEKLEKRVTKNLDEAEKELLVELLEKALKGLDEEGTLS